MTRIAVLGDIHGNLPALEAVLADLREIAPDHVVVNGDLVNRGPQSKECLDAVRAQGWPVVFGNHEEYVLKFTDGDTPAEWRTDFWLPTRRVAEQELAAADLAYLRALPHSHVVEVPGLPPVRVVHGSPRQLNEGIGVWQSDAALCEIAAGIPETVLVGAHTHRSFERRVGERWFLNCGAVGAPFNGDPGAQYLVLTARGGAWQADFRSVPYDRETLYVAWNRAGYLERSMVAQVFKYEVETATFHLQAYFNFCRDHNLDVNALPSFTLYRTFAQDTVPERSLRFAPEGA